MKLVYHLPWEKDPLAGLKAQHDDIEFVRAKTTADAAKELVDADVLVIGGQYYAGDVSAAINAPGTTVRWVQSSSIGTDKFEEGGLPEGVLFSTAAGLKGKTVAEHALAMLLGHLHALPQIERFKTAAHWGRDDLRTQIACIEDQTALLLGYGSIGKEIARKLKAFDAHVVALNSSGKGEPPADLIEPVSKLAEWLPKADFILCSLPLTAETEHLIAAPEFSVMKESAIIVNVGRGPVIDQAALARALSDNVIAGACLDVYDIEPLPADSPFWALPNVMLSPHVAGTGGSMEGSFGSLVDENLTRFKDGRPLVNALKIINS